MSLYQDAGSLAVINQGSAETPSGGNVSETFQRGGAGTMAFVTQEGHQNYALADQYGSGFNFVQILQLGDLNNARVLQDGDGHGAEVAQFGTGQAVRISQSGSGHTAAVLQQ